MADMVADGRENTALLEDGKILYTGVDMFKFIMGHQDGENEMDVLVWVCSHFLEAVVGEEQFRSKTGTRKVYTQWVTYDDMAYVVSVYMTSIKRWRAKQWENDNKGKGDNPDAKVDDVTDTGGSNKDAAVWTEDDDQGQEAKKHLLKAMGNGDAKFLCGAGGQSFYEYMNDRIESMFPDEKAERLFNQKFYDELGEVDSKSKRGRKKVVGKAYDEKRREKRMKRLRFDQFAAV